MAEDGKFKDKLINIFGLGESGDDEDFYEEDYSEESYYPETQPEQKTETVQRTTRRTEAVTTPPVSTDTSSLSSKSPDVLVLDPETFEEAPSIVNKLKQDKTVVVNLKQTDFDEGKKIFDFLSGAVFALEGSLNRIAESVFILAPKKIKVETSIKEPVIEEEI